MKVNKLLVITAMSLTVFILPMTVGVYLSKKGYDYPVLAYVSAVGGIAFAICFVRIIEAILRRIW